jgi:hypothetical protein
MLRPLAAVAAGIATGVVIAGCAATALPAGSVSSPSVPATKSTIDHWTAVARGHYDAEVRGGTAYAQLHRVARDPALGKALRAGDPAAVRAYVKQQYNAVWYHRHVSHLRIWQGSRMIADEGVPFCVDGPKMTLRGAGGRAIATLQVSIQDEIGVVRLMTHTSPVDVVVRGTGPAHVRSSIPAAAKAKLPSRGQATIAGRRYLVRSFHETALGGEPVTVWILQRG